LFAQGDGRIGPQRAERGCHTRQQRDERQDGGSGGKRDRVDWVDGKE
jgi:hypothetical protein